VKRLNTQQLLNYCRKGLVVLTFLATIVYAATPSVSDDFTDRRITAGARIFRALLAADVHIDEKTSRSGELRLCLLYVDDKSNAEKAAATLANRNDSRIRNNAVRLEILSYPECVSGSGPRFAGVFLTQNLPPEKLQSLIAFANKQHLVIFSPFEGDVERGVQSGIAIEARVRPYINPTALQAAGVQLKSFFKKVAKAYED